MTRTPETPTYKSWRCMRDRCLRPANTHYALYGGRGITVCDRWLSSFPSFLSDMGERPTGHTLDRIDGNGNYEPANCRWADQKTQVRNSSKFILTDEQVLIIREMLTMGVPRQKIADLLGIHRSHIGYIGSGRERGDAEKETRAPALAALRKAVRKGIDYANEVASMCRGEGMAERVYAERDAMIAALGQAAEKRENEPNPYWYCKPCRTLHQRGAPCPRGEPHG